MARKYKDKFEQEMEYLESVQENNMEAFLKKDVDLSKFFSPDELKKMCEAEQRRYKNIALNYEMMVMMRLPAIKPAFMQGPAHRALQAKTRQRSQSLTSDSDTGSDEEWTPDIERKRKAKESKRVPHFEPKRSRTMCNGRVSKQKDQKQLAPQKKPIKGSYNLRERTNNNYMYLEPPDDDHFLYCEECNKEYDMDCPVHGPMNYIQDTKVVDSCNQSKAMQTLPPSMTVKSSSIPGAGLGVFTTVNIPPRTMFGPYGGIKTADAEKAHSSGYCWQVYKDGKPSHFVDAQDESNSNWMRFVNCANSETDQNLVAFQFKGGIYYRSYKCIPAGVELLVWYGDEYARELGVVRDKNLLLRPKLVNGEECFPCVFCKTAFSGPAYCVRHLIHQHGKDKLTQTDIRVLDEWLRTNTDYRSNRHKPAPKMKINRSDSIDNPATINQNSECVSCESKSTLDNQALQDLAGAACKQNISNDYRFLEGNKKLTSDMKMRNIGNIYQCNVNECKTSLNGDLITLIGPHAGEKPYKCEVCSYATNQKSNLVTHMRTYTGEKPYKCEVCSYATSVKCNFINHMRTHTGEKPYKCEVCSYAASEKGDLVKHMRTHTGEKPYKCEVCSYAASQKGPLVTHMRTHTGEKPYKCEVCSYAASQKGLLVTHMRTHTGEKPYKCEVCSYAASEKGHLVKHMRTHTGEKPYKCEVCSYAASQKGDLVKHMRTHTGEKPYKCEVCSYAASEKGHLVKHMRTHTGKKPYKCEVCSYAASVKCNFVNHKRIHV